MATSDEDLQKQMDEVQKLRDQVAAENAKRLAKEAEQVNDVTAAQLKAEKEKLQAELAALKEASTATAVKQGVANVIDPQGTAEKAAVAAEAEKNGGNS